MKIRTKVKAGRGCGLPDIQSGHATLEAIQPGHAGNGAARSPTPFPHKETTMKIRTKVKAGRGCGGGGATPDIQSGRTTQRLHNPGTPATVRPFSSKETIMKIKTKVKAGRDCSQQRPYHVEATPPGARR